MLVTVRTKTPFISSAEVAYATEWFAQKILGKRLANNVSVEILSLPIEDSKYLYGRMETHEFNRSPRSFTFEINRMLRRRRYLKTLVHEMEHVKQYARDDMRDAVGPKVLWKGKRIVESEIEYLNRPWEKEAFAAEEKWFPRYMKHLETEGLQFS